MSEPIVGLVIFVIFFWVIVKIILRVSTGRGRRVSKPARAPKRQASRQKGNRQASKPTSTSNKAPHYRKGEYQPWNWEKYMGDADNIVYRSSWEREAFKWCDWEDIVLQWSSEEVHIPYSPPTGNKMRMYYPDLLIKLKGGKMLLVEIKPESETKEPMPWENNYERKIEKFNVNAAKWTAAEEYAEEKGWEFQIWTERAMRKVGILPDP